MTTGAASLLDAVAWPLATERLAIRRATSADVEATWRYRRLESVNRWITSAPPDVEAYRVRFDEPDGLNKTLIIEQGGEVIGDLMLAIEDAWAQAEVLEPARNSQAELGWALHPDHSGQGYAYEAVRELIRTAFVEVGLRRVTAQCFAENTSSRRLMERLGMRLESLLVRDSLHRSGEWMDTAGYGLLAEEWPTPDRRS